MKITRFKHYKNLYSQAYESQVTIDNKWTGVFSKVVVNQDNSFTIYTSVPTDNTLTYRRTVKSLRRAKFIAREWLFVSIKQYLKGK